MGEFDLSHKILQLIQNFSFKNKAFSNQKNFQAKELILL